MFKNLYQIIIVICISIAIGIAAWCFLLKKSFLEDRLIQEDFLFREKVVVKKAQENLSRLQNEIDGLNGNIERLIKKAALLESELIAGKQELDRAKQELDRLDAQDVSLNKEIEQAQSSIKELKKRIAYSAQEVLKADERLSLLVKTKDALMRQLEEYTEKQAQAVPAPARKQIIPSTTEQAYPEYGEIDERDFLTGEVLTVNREFAFLVVNLGKSSGITEGMQLSIRRDNRNLAQVKVETVRENISAAALIDKDNLSQIRAGDRVLVLDDI
jgi:chromosome segregation ATPase